MQFLTFFVLGLLLVASSGQVITIQPQEFYNGLVNGTYDLVIDTRTQAEWDEGHVPNATLVESLQLETSIPSSIQGCEGACRSIVVYCRSGNRAGTAANLLIQQGFQGTIYNGLGVNQWTAVGYELVDTPSFDPPCALVDGVAFDTCPGDETATPPPVATPIPSPVSTPAPSSVSTLTPPPTAGTPPSQVITIQPQEFYNGLVNGTYDLVIDTRTQAEWDEGHVPNATLVESLQLETSIPSSIQGCEGACRSIVVYCRSGNRAGTAANLLIQQGFQGTIYNGLGVNQWTAVGYELVDTPSFDPPCALVDGVVFDACPGDETATPPPVATPIPTPVSTPAPSSVSTLTPPPTAGTPPSQVITIQPQEFYNGLVNGTYDLVIDTRTQAEWDEGHVPNATLVESLQLETSIPSSIQGCEGACRSIVVYCRSGNRAGTAANLLIQQGFQGTIYNGLGVNQWTAVGYELVDTPSFDPPCALVDGVVFDACPGDETATPPPVATPIPTPVSTPAPSSVSTLTPPPTAGTPPSQVITIQPQEFYNGLVNGTYDLVIDTRTQAEWDEGHVPNATLVESLQLETSIPSSIQGCEGACRSIVVYCRSGNRAGVAAKLLIQHGFQGTIYNGLGVSQWTAVGYELVDTPSFDPPCASIGGRALDTCEGETTTPSPAGTPTSKAKTASFLSWHAVFMMAGFIFFANY